MFFNKMQQIQFANRFKITQKIETEKNRTLVKNRKFCVTSTILLTRFLKADDKSFLNVMGIYLKENHYEKVNGKIFFKRDRGTLAPLPPSFLCLWLFSITNILILRSTRPESKNCYHDYCTFQKTKN